MSNSGDAAEQVVRMSLEGTEVAVRIAGDGAKKIALLLYAVLKDQKKTSGKMRLTNMLRSGKELKVFAVDDKAKAKAKKEEAPKAANRRIRAKKAEPKTEEPQVEAVETAETTEA